MLAADGRDRVRGRPRRRRRDRAAFTDIEINDLNGRFSLRTAGPTHGQGTHRGVGGQVTERDGDRRRAQLCAALLLG